MTLGFAPGPPKRNVKAPVMDKIGNALYLGGYGIYVWPAFAFAAAVLCWMAVSTVRRLRHNERRLAALQQARGRSPVERADAKDEGTGP